jgi:CheY-like chemotaxis protein
LSVEQPAKKMSAVFVRNCLYTRQTSIQKAIGMKQLENIWIIDDDFVARFIAQKELITHKAMVNVREFENGKQAITALLEDHTVLPDLILLDINMPVLNGWGFLELFDQKFPQMDAPNLFLLTSSIDPQDLERANKHPRVRAMLTKPFTMSQLFFHEQKV